MRAILTILLIECLFGESMATAGQAENDRKRINLHVHYKTAGWTMTTPTPDDPGSHDPTLTYSVFRSVVQAVDPVSGEPYDKTIPEPRCQPGDLRIRFRLEKKEFLVGEPILVEFVIELDGLGRYPWTIGGNLPGLGTRRQFRIHHAPSGWSHGP
jgi:hypothetical protein